MHLHRTVLRMTSGVSVGARWGAHTYSTQALSTETLAGGETVAVGVDGLPEEVIGVVAGDGIALLFQSVLGE